MGNCVKANYTGDNFSPNMKQYVDLKIGQNFTHPGYCEYCTTSSVNCGNNGEFIPNGNSGGKCKCRALCTDGCCRKNCKRVTYSGSASECCQRGGPSYYVDNQGIVRTCDPTYRSNNWENKPCDQIMKNYCKQGDNLFGSACRQWVTTYQPTGNLSNAVGNGAVDDVILDVCNRPENASRSECGCIVAANVVRTKLPDASDVPVQCLVNSCANNPGAYRTTDQMQPCDVVNCQISLDDVKVITGDNSVFNMNFAQNCYKKSVPNGPNIPFPPDVPTSTKDKIAEMFKEYWYLVLIFIFILMIIIYLVFVSDDDDDDDE